MAPFIRAVFQQNDSVVDKTERQHHKHERNEYLIFTPRGPASILLVGHIFIVGSVHGEA
jgi:hypothetical protein